MTAFRNDTPKHRKGRKSCKKYSSYRKTLRVDFLKRCGYCNDLDILRNRSYVIDHFLPMKPDGWTHSVRSNKYINLIYACPYCNGSKSNTWPTKDWKKPNDGTVGFVKPTMTKYGKLFRRQSDGTIVVYKNNPLGKYMHGNLDLNQPIHSMHWKMEKLMENERILKGLLKTASTKVAADLKEVQVALWEISSQIREIYNA